MEAELHAAPLPPAGAYLWSVFVRLHNRRGSGGLGLSPILWADIEAFTRLSGIVLTPWEVETIEALDGAFMAEQGKRGRKGAEDER